MIDELKPALARFRQVADGIRFQAVLGRRVLIEGITPRTMMDQVSIYVPEYMRRANTPPATTGIVLMLGPDIPPERAAQIPPGTMVFYGPHAGTGFRLEGRDGLRILDVDEVLATLETDPGVVKLEEPKKEE